MEGFLNFLYCEMKLNLDLNNCKKVSVIMFGICLEGHCNPL